MSIRLGFDIGGTFTDVFAIDEEAHEVIQTKVPTTPADFSEGAIRGITKLMRENDIDADDLTHLSHGTTVATNTMIEEDGATTGLITTDGFRDNLAIGRESRSDLYDYSPEKIPEFVERRRRIGVSERLSADGTILDELDEDEVIEAIETLQEESVESIAVSFIHSYRNPSHERRVRELIEQETNLPVSLSSDIMPEIKEYERTLSTVINAYVTPDTEEYIARLETALSERGIDEILYLMQANGGVVPSDNLQHRILRLINSGPAGGVIGAKRAAKTSGIENIITLDMGGTSADACVVRDGTIETTTEGTIAGIPLLFPQVDIRTVGAGGGSIVSLNRANVIQIGPESAGADPGPACYGRGGTRATVTDAALVLGYLNPHSLVEGEMELDADAAYDAVEDLSEELDKSPTHLADGILDIATTNITQALRLVTVEKGYDPRNFTLTCFGGAGPMFTTRMARKLGIKQAIIPTTPGVLSATGLVTADEQFDFSKSQPMSFAEATSTDITAIYDGLLEEAESTVGDRLNQGTLLKSVDMRYIGQTSKVNVGVPSDTIDEAATRDMIQRFHDQYETMYDHANRDKPVEGVTWRLRFVAETSSVNPAPTGSKQSVTRARQSERDVFIDGGFQTVPVYDRYQLPPNERFDGPTIIEEAGSTTVIDEESTIFVDDADNLRVELA